MIAAIENPYMAGGTILSCVALETVYGQFLRPTALELRDGAPSLRGLRWGNCLEADFVHEQYRMIFMFEIVSYSGSNVKQ